MKLSALLVKSLMAAALFGLTSQVHAQGYGSAPAPKPADDTKKPDAAEAKIPGFVIARGNGGFLGLQIDDSSNFKLSFYDKDKKPVAPDVASATITWRPTNVLQQQNYALGPDSDGLSLSCSRFVHRPWTFKLYINLFATATATNPVESYNVDFSQ